MASSWSETERRRGLTIWSWRAWVRGQVPLQCDVINSRSGTSSARSRIPTSQPTVQALNFVYLSECSWSTKIVPHCKTNCHPTQKNGLNSHSQVGSPFGTCNAGGLPILQRQHPTSGLDGIGQRDWQPAMVRQEWLLPLSLWARWRINNGIILQHQTRKDHNEPERNGRKTVSISCPFIEFDDAGIQGQ